MRAAIGRLWFGFVSLVVDAPASAVEGEGDGLSVEGGSATVRCGAPDAVRCGAPSVPSLHKYPMPQ